MTLTQTDDQGSLTDLVNRSLSVSLNPARVEESPSPHFYQLRAFEPEVFDRICNCLPDSEHYGGMEGRTGNVRAQKARLVLPLFEKNLSVLPSDQKDFWTEMALYFRSTDFAQLALAAYAPVIGRERPDLIDHRNFEIRFELLRDTTAYGIGPHSDHPNKVMTLLFYLSSGDTKETLGTSFYVPKRKGFTCETGRHHDYKDFDLIKTYPYAPNAVLSFLKTSTSFHGVEVIEEENVQRDVLRWMLWKT